MGSSDTPPKILKEILKLRGENNKTYELDNGQFQLQGFKSAIHYKDGKEVCDRTFKLFKDV